MDANGDSAWGGHPVPALPFTPFHVGTPLLQLALAAGLRLRGAAMKNKPTYVLLAGLLAGIAHAQKIPDLVADEVVVTATRFEEKSSDLPVNVQVINAAQIAPPADHVLGFGELDGAAADILIAGADRI